MAKNHKGRNILRLIGDINYRSVERIGNGIQFVTNEELLVKILPINDSGLWYDLTIDDNHIGEVYFDSLQRELRNLT